MQNITKTFVASASELQSSDLYMTIKTTMFTVPEANLNGVRCTAAFLDEIVQNQEKYIGLPLCADVKNLEMGRYMKLGHCYNATTGTFSSSIIGSFYKFEKEEREDGCALIGYARVMKRNKRVCKAIGELFAEGMLKFSFEISCGSYEELEDETLLIDAADNNYLEGMCIVSFPACPDAVAMELVAEISNIRKEADDMTDVIESAEVLAEESVVETPAPEAEEIVAETEPVTEPAAEPEEIQAEVSEPEKEEEEEKPEEDPDPEEDEEKKETAAVYTTVRETQIHEESTYDNETGEETNVRVIVEQSVHGREDSSNQAIAETEDVVAEEVSEPEQNDELAELRREIAELKQAIEAMKEEKTVVAEVETAEEKEEVEVNPFIAEISTPVKYSLLERIEKNPHSLLERA